MGWLVLGSLVTLFVAILLWRLWAGKRRPGYLALVEFWVYSDVQRLPPTEALMDAIVSKNPHNRAGKPSITAREGILFSDLRLHLAIARKEKNPHAFRPDLFDDHAVPNADILNILANCRTLSNLKYASNVPLSDRRHLQFMTHLVDTVSRLTRGQLIFDTISGRFWMPSELHDALQINNDGERPDLHLRVVWDKTAEGCQAKTLGLRKVGRPEMTTSLQEPDEEVIVVGIMEQVSRRLFLNPELQLPQDVIQHNDTFTVSENAMTDGEIEVKIVRRQRANS